MIPRFISRGAAGYIYQINEFTVVKRARPQASDEFNNEIAVYDVFQKQEPSPYVMQSFFCIPEAIFLPFLSGGSLQDRLRGNQLRQDDIFVRVVRTERMELIEQWTMEIAAGSAWVESLGYAHGDLRPANLLLDAEGHLRLTDFGCAERIGTPASGNGPPWARLLGSEAGDSKGTWGPNGPRLEQFAIGSIIYCMTRGRQPYEGEIEDGPTQVQMLQDMDFPELGHEQLDTIISNCWRGAFHSLQDLASATRLLKGALVKPPATSLSNEYCRIRKEECQDLIRQSLLPPVLS